MRTWRLVVLMSFLLVINEAWAQKSASATRSGSGLKAGLKGEYFNGPNFERKVMTRTDTQIDFNWNWESPGPGVQREYFSVRWTGKLYAPTTGKYRFSATVDDGVRVWVNGRKVIDEWRKQDDSQFIGEIALNGHQQYDLKVEYYNDWKGSVISVFWETPEDRSLLSFTSKPHQVIPAKYLFSKPERVAPVAARPTPIRALAVPPASRSLSNPPAPQPATLKPGQTPAKRRTESSLALAGTPVQKPVSVAAVAPPLTVPPDPADQPFGNLNAGQTVVLRHVVFAQSDYTLLPESEAELNKLVQTLQANPTIRIEIAGHTDNVGDKRLNQALSEYRAKIVAGYLIRHGIADTRITATGYGGTRPIADNDSETQRARNRRVEFIVQP